MSSSPETAGPPPDADAAVLRIVAGLHAGASRPLSRREMVLIGSGDDCDVVLADPGVAAHHALLNIVDGRFHLRALDAPVELPGRTLHPGDPVEIAQVQRIGMGQAAIAFGRVDAVEWLGIAPEHAPEGLPRQQRADGITARLPLIAGVAVLALAGLAIYAALTPARPPEMDVEQRLRAIAREHRVSDMEITRDVDGRAVLGGTVADRATRDRIVARLSGEALPARASLRTGEDLATDVAEVMRTGGFPVEAEYLGNNNVRVTGDFGGDERAVRDFIRSRAMVETGVNMVEPVNTNPDAADAVAERGADAEEARAHIVSVVRGEQPYIVDADGNRYLDGATVPGWGKLVSIGTRVHVIRPDGTLAEIKPSPPPRPEEDEADDGADADADAAPSADPQAHTASRRQRVHEHEATRAIRAGVAGVG